MSSQVSPTPASWWERRGHRGSRRPTTASHRARESLGEAIEGGADPDLFHEGEGIPLALDTACEHPTESHVPRALQLGADEWTGNGGRPGHTPAAVSRRRAPARRRGTPRSRRSSRCRGAWRRRRSRPTRSPTFSRPSRSTVLATAPMSPAVTLRETRSSSRVSSVVTRSRVVIDPWSYRCPSMNARCCQTGKQISIPSVSASRWMIFR